MIAAINAKAGRNKHNSPEVTLFGRRGGQTGNAGHGAKGVVPDLEQWMGVYIPIPFPSNGGAFFRYPLSPAALTGFPCVTLGERTSRATRWCLMGDSTPGRPATALFLPAVAPSFRRKELLALLLLKCTRLGCTNGFPLRLNGLRTQQNGVFAEFTPF